MAILTRLPAEIMAQILKYLAFFDHLSLSLTSKYLYQLIERRVPSNVIDLQLGLSRLIPWDQLAIHPLLSRAKQVQATLLASDDSVLHGYHKGYYLASLRGSSKAVFRKQTSLSQQAIPEPLLDEYFSEAAPHSWIVYFYWKEIYRFAEQACDHLENEIDRLRWTHRESDTGVQQKLELWEMWSVNRFEVHSRIERKPLRYWKSPSEGQEEHGLEEILV